MTKALRRGLHIDWACQASRHAAKTFQGLNDLHDRLSKVLKKASRGILRGTRLSSG